MEDQLKTFKSITAAQLVAAMIQGKDIENIDSDKIVSKAMELVNKVMNYE